MSDPRRGVMRAGVMRAVGITRFGGPGVLEIVGRPVPDPGAGEVRIRVAAETVNPTDTVLRAGRHGAPEGLEPPYVPGMELAGTVDAAPAGSGFRPGDRVMAIVSPRTVRGGAQAEWVVVPADSVVAVPDGIGLAEAATLATGDGADALVDAAVMGHRVLAGVRDGGQVAAVRPFRGETERSIKVIEVRVRDYLHATDKLADLARLAAAGQLTLRVARTLPAQRAAEAHRLLEAGGVRGRLVLTF